MFLTVASRDGNVLWFRKDSAVRNSWSGLWSLKALEQAKLEKNNNSKLRGVMTDLCVESEQCSKCILLPECIVIMT